MLSLQKYNQSQTGTTILGALVAVVCFNRYIYSLFRFALYLGNPALVLGSGSETVTASASPSSSSMLNVSTFDSEFSAIARAAKKLERFAR